MACPVPAPGERGARCAGRSRPRARSPQSAVDASAGKASRMRAARGRGSWSRTRRTRQAPARNWPASHAARRSSVSGSVCRPTDRARSRVRPAACNARRKIAPVPVHQLHCGGRRYNSHGRNGSREWQGRRAVPAGPARCQARWRIWTSSTPVGGQPFGDNAVNTRWSGWETGSIRSASRCRSSSSSPCAVIRLSVSHGNHIAAATGLS